jgi:hypothetical protein
MSGGFGNRSLDDWMEPLFEYLMDLAEAILAETFAGSPIVPVRTTDQ